MISDTRAYGTPIQQTTTYERQPTSGTLLSVTDALGRKTAYTYDALGETTSVTRLAGTASAVTTNYSYPPLVSLNYGLNSPSFGSPSSLSATRRRSTTTAPGVSSL